MAIMRSTAPTILTPDPGPGSCPDFRPGRCPAQRPGIRPAQRPPEARGCPALHPGMQPRPSLQPPIPDRARSLFPRRLAAVWALAAVAEGAAAAGIAAAAPTTAHQLALRLPATMLLHWGRDQARRLPHARPPLGNQVSHWFRRSS